MTNQSVLVVSGPSGCAPVRPANSVRRTSTVDMSWVDGFGSQLRLDGRSRDALTRDPADAPEVLRAATMNAGIGLGRTIQDISATPTPANLQRLVGCSGGGRLRGALEQHLPEELANGTPLYLLLDDISGTSLISGFVWSRWMKNWMKDPDATRQGPNMAGVCIGFAPGSANMDENGVPAQGHEVQPVVSLVNPQDPHGWHERPDPPKVFMCRARRIDVWVDDHEIHIDSAFQDTAGDPEFGRIAVHEYLLRATADRATGRITKLDPDPRVLPYATCPGAVARARELVGTPLADLRSVVLDRLAKTNGCTHLNDALRALAEVPILIDYL